MKKKRLVVLGLVICTVLTGCAVAKGFYADEGSPSVSGGNSYEFTDESIDIDDLTEIPNDGQGRIWGSDGSSYQVTDSELLDKIYNSIDEYKGLNN